MIANVGMIYPVAAAVKSAVQGSAVTYNNGFVIDEARGASLTWETEDGEFYGDDHRLDSVNDVIGYTLEMEVTGLKDTVRAGLLGEVKDGDVYKVTGASAPDVGVGYIRRMRDNAEGSVTEKFEAWWYYKMKFSMPNEETRTKERTVEWRTPTISGKGDGVYQSANAEKPDFCEHQTFATMALAKAYLNGKAGITG